MSACRWVGSDQPRMLKERHDDGCADETCGGCQPCMEPHCRVQSKPYCEDDEPCLRHAESVCAVCLGRVREHIIAIARMYATLPAEVVHDGVESDAMAALGPVADPESWGHHEASALVGRIVPVGTDAKNVEDVRAHYEDRNLSPLWVLGSWQMMAEETYGGPSDQRVEVTTAAAWLLDLLHFLAADADFPFEQLADDMRDCRRALEAMLRDGEQTERGAPCPRCEKPQPRLVKRYANDRSGANDTWQCPHDRNHWWTEAEYRKRVSDDFVVNAKALNLTDMMTRTNVTRGSLTGWAAKGHVRKYGKDHSGRQLYDVSDVERMMEQTSRRLRDEDADRAVA